ncbi:MAG: hypothetical protein K6E90_01900, partial [Lachnospiraceae bacterium]|nr:hypothetical protein [Lachnospiraceae bacterium]
EDAYKREFSAVIEGIEVKDQDTCLVRLNRTLFFPEEGGQTSDIGTLGSFKVTHVSIEDDIITHTVMCRADDLKTGDEVSGVIDWKRRFSNMQNHTGEHILSGIMHREWGIENKGFHLSDSIVTVDTSSELPEEDLKKLEMLANDAVYRNIPTECRYYDAASLEGMSYRSKIDVKDSLRIVTIPGIDVCACCAPHVSHTGEIGIIKIIRAIRYKGGMRLTILCGERAFSHLSRIQDITDDLSHMLSENTDKLTEAVDRLLNDNNDLKIKIKNDAAKRLERDIEELDSNAPVAVLFTDAVDNTVQRKAVNRLSESRDTICAVFSSDGDGGYNYILSYPGHDARGISSLLKEKLGARGGGSLEMVQGNIKASEEEISALLRQE